MYYIYKGLDTNMDMDRCTMHVYHMYTCFDTGPETLLASLRPAISPDIPGKMKNKTGKGCFTIAKKGQSFFAMLPTSDMGKIGIG